MCLSSELLLAIAVIHTIRTPAIRGCQLSFRSVERNVPKAIFQPQNASTTSAEVELSQAESFEWEVFGQTSHSSQVGNYAPRAALWMDDLLTLLGNFGPPGSFGERQVWRDNTAILLSDDAGPTLAYGRAK